MHVWGCVGCRKVCLPQATAPYVGARDRMARPPWVNNIYLQVCSIDYVDVHPRRRRKKSYFFNIAIPGRLIKHRERVLQAGNPG